MSPSRVCTECEVGPARRIGFSCVPTEVFSCARVEVTLPSAVVIAKLEASRDNVRFEIDRGKVADRLF